MDYEDIDKTLEHVAALLDAGAMADASAALDQLDAIPLDSEARGRAFALRVACLERIGLPNDAQQLILDTMAEDGDDLGFVSSAGLTFSDVGEFEYSETFLRNLIELEPANPVPPFNLAISLGRQGRYPECIELYDEALRRDPQFAPALSQKAYCLTELDRAPEAIAVYRSYLELDPEDGDAWNVLAQLEEETGNLGGAYAAYDSAASATGDPLLYLFNCVQTAAGYGDGEQLEKCLARLHEIDEMDWRTLYARSAYSELQEDIWPAWSQLQDALGAALDVEDRDGANASLAALFRFATRNDVGDEIDDYIVRAFDEGLLSQPVLEALQELEGTPSNALSSYQIVLRTVLSTVVRGNGDDTTRYRIYGVSAETSDSASSLAMEFEARCTGDGWTVDSAQRVSEAGHGHDGVYWQSELVDRPPNRTATAGGATGAA